jgi:hypothetical protein
MTVGDLEQRMTHAELMGWLVIFKEESDKHRDEEIKLAALRNKR